MTETWFNCSVLDNEETDRMNLIGTWVIKEYFTETETGHEWRLVSDLQNDNTLTDAVREFLTTRLVFEEDGTLKNLYAVPDGVSQEELERAVESGEIKLYDSRTIVEETAWKEENGKFYYDSGILVDYGQVFFYSGQTFSRWREIKRTEDGIEWLCCRLVKSE